MATAAAADLVLDTALVKKYDGFGPRYTSYPTADRFHAGVTAEHYVNALARAQPERPAAPLSLYVHIPFCNTICYYCACNKVITKDHGRSAKYIKYVGREIEIVSGLIEGGPKVEQVHLGGGTPTFLARDEMSTLMGMLRGGLRVRAGRRDLDRGRSAQGRRRHDRVSRRGWASTGFRSASRISTRSSSRR